MLSNLTKGIRVHLNGVTFNWIDPRRGMDRQMGLIAQDVAPVFPETIHEEEAARSNNLLRLIQLSVAEGRTLLPEQAELLLTDLRRLAKAAADAKWEPDRDKKIITRTALRSWWKTRADEIVHGAGTASGGN